MCSKSASAEMPMPGVMTPPRYSPLARNYVEGGRRAKIHDDARTAKLFEGRHTVDDAIGADLGGIVIVHRHAGLDARLDEQRARVEVSFADLAQGGVERRHHRRDHGALHRAHFQSIHRKQIAEENAVLVNGLGLDGRDAPVRDELPVVHDAVLGRLGFEDSQHRVGVAYIQNKKHGLSFTEGANSSREHRAQPRRQCAPAGSRARRDLR